MTTATARHADAHLTAQHWVDEHWIETLGDGSRVLIRPIRREDRQRESDFLERLSAQTRHFRFLGEINPRDPALLEQMVTIDHRKTMAYVALAHDDGELREVGVSRYCAGDDGQRCECAVVIADDWRQRGLDAALMRHLIEVARRNGFRQMYSIDASANEPMRELAHQLGFYCRQDEDDATQVVHTLDL